MHRLKFEASFSQRLSSARIVIEQAFGRLKQRWRCLLKRCDASPKNARLVIAACMTLHNICETAGDNIEVDVSAPEEDSGGFGDMDNSSGSSVREQLAQFIHS